MLSREFIRTQPERVKQAVAQRCDSAPIDEIVQLDLEQRALKAEGDELKAERNRISKSFGDKSLDDEQRAALRAQATSLRDRIADVDSRIEQFETRLHELELWVPNIPDADVPLGRTEEDNVERWSWGSPRQFDFPPKSHADLGEQLGMYSTEAAVRMAGTRFHTLNGPGAHMERALAAFMLDLHTKEHGFTEMWIPYLVRSEAMVISGQLPKFAEDAYYLEHDDMYLIPTAEVPLVNLQCRYDSRRRTTAIAVCGTQPFVPQGSGRSGPRHQRADPGTPI